MKKRYRIITSLILVAILVTTLVAPASAAEITDFSGSGTREGYSFTVRIYHTETSGYAQARITSSAPAYVTSKAANKLYYDLEDEYGYSDLATCTGYYGAIAVSNNQMLVRGVRVRAEVLEAYGNITIAGNLVHDDVPQAVKKKWGLT